ncbi:MAG TPA: methyltransferase domain-containing protein [Pyrinomonadaceae bacterium]|nr:methyltransferase domain-containing protein [Pyrinomonadaceae bacterium]
MQMKLLEVLGCPKCRGELALGASVERDAEGNVETGELSCARCAVSYPIRSGIPRFIGDDNYASSFGYQWNRFRLEQLDSANGTHLSHKRFYSETEWPKEWMAGKWILDAGCGAGRFLDVAAQTGAQVVGMDISSAIEASRDNLKGNPNAHFVQASIYEMPFRDGVFDGVYCIGVIQHTPDPLKSVRALPRVLRAGGRIAYSMYEKRKYTLFHSKYILRPLTKKMGQKTLLQTIRAAMPVLFPLSEVAFRVPVAKRFLQFAIPIANYVGEPELNVRQRYAWSLMDTFDMLAPQYDQPQTEPDVTAAMQSAGITDIRRTPIKGLALVGRKVSSNGTKPTGE